MKNYSIFSPQIFQYKILMDAYKGDRPTDYKWNTKGMFDAHNDMQKDPQVLQ